MKSFYEMLQVIESMDVRVKDANYGNPMANLSDLSWFIMNQLGSFFRSFNQEQKDYLNKNRTHEIVAPDGDGYFSNTGIINVYLSSIPPELRSKLKEAVLYFLKDAGVEYGTPYVNKSNLYKDVEVLRVPIQGMQEPKSNPPELNMSNGNTFHIFNTVLGIPVEDYGLEISARELLMKINMYNSDLADMDARLTTTGTGSGGSNFVSFGLSGDQIRERLEKVAAIAKWAIDNDYETIQVH